MTKGSRTSKGAEKKYVMRDARAMAGREASREDKLLIKSRIEKNLEKNAQDFLAYFSDYFLGNEAELSELDRLALEEMRKIRKSFEQVAAVEIAPATENPARAAMVQCLIQLLGHVTEASLMLDYYERTRVAAYSPRPLVTPISPPIVSAAKTTPTAGNPLAASARGKLPAASEERLSADRESATANRGLRHAILPQITSEQLGIEIEKLRAEHPGEKISLAGLGDRFATDETGKVILQKMDGLDLHDVDFSSADVWHFLDCNLSGANFAGMNHARTIFERCNLDQADFSNATGRLRIASYQSSPAHFTSFKGANFNGATLRLAFFGSELIDFRGATFKEATLLYPPEHNPSNTFLSTQNLDKTGINFVLDEGSSTEERRTVAEDAIDDTALPRSVRPYVKPSSFLFGPPTHNCSEDATTYRITSSDPACEGLTLSPARSKLRGISPEIIKKFVTGVNKKLERYGLRFTDEDGCQDYATTLCEADLASGYDGVASTIVHGRNHAFAIIGSHLTANHELSAELERVISHELFHTLGLHHGNAGGEVLYSDAPPLVLSVMDTWHSYDFPPLDSESLGISDHETFETIWGRNPQYQPQDRVVEMRNGATQIIRQGHGTVVNITINQDSSYTYAEEDPSTLQQNYFLSGQMRIFNLMRYGHREASVIVIDNETINVVEESRSTGSESESGSGHGSGSGSTGSKPERPTPTSSPVPPTRGRPTPTASPPPKKAPETQTTKISRPAAIGIGAGVGALLAAICIVAHRARRRRNAVAPLETVVVPSEPASRAADSALSVAGTDGEKSANIGDVVVHLGEESSITHVRDEEKGDAATAAERSEGRSAPHEYRMSDLTLADYSEDETDDGREDNEDRPASRVATPQSPNRVAPPLPETNR